VELRSSAFAPGSSIPSRHSWKGGDFSPRLDWRAVPEDAVSLALIVNDPDARADRFTPWLAWDIAPQTGRPAEGKHAPRKGRNDFGAVGYPGPGPRRGHRTHRHFLHLYALGRQPAHRSRVDRRDLKRDMDGCVVEVAELVGILRR
jgi:Raf kinase inhibitor-like YbhB/YbcL family protein